MRVFAVFVAAVALFALIDAACWNGVTPSPQSPQYDTVCSSSKLSSCCPSSELNSIRQRLNFYQLLTGDNTNLCYRYLNQFECARCSNSSSLFVQDGNVTLCYTDCADKLYTYCSTYLFGLTSFCGNPELQTPVYNTNTSATTNCLQLNSAAVSFGGLPMTMLFALVMAVVVFVFSSGSSSPTSHL